MKAEPFPDQTETSNNQYTMVEQEQAYPVTNHQHQRGTIAHPDMQYGEDYTDYGEYENNGDQGMQDGNKGNLARPYWGQP